MPPFTSQFDIQGRPIIPRQRKLPYHSASHLRRQRRRVRSFLSRSLGLLNLDALLKLGCPLLPQFLVRQVFLLLLQHLRTNIRVEIRQRKVLRRIGHLAFHPLLDLPLRRNRHRRQIIRQIRSRTDLETHIFEVLLSAVHRSPVDASAGSDHEDLVKTFGEGVTGLVGGREGGGFGVVGDGAEGPTKLEGGRGVETWYLASVSSTIAVSESLTSRRLIESNHRRPSNQRLRQRNPLPLPSTHTPHTLVPHLGIHRMLYPKCFQQHVPVVLFVLFTGHAFRSGGGGGGFHFEGEFDGLIDSQAMLGGRRGIR